MENFVHFQYYYTFFCLIVTFFVWFVYRQMDQKAAQLDKKSKVEAADGDNFKKAD